MTNKEMLMGILRKAKMTQADLAEKIGISRQSMSYKINSKRDFKQGEIDRICITLNIDSSQRESIFFAA